MKIAFFADSYKPYISGVVNSIDVLAHKLRSLGHSVTVFAPGYPGEEKEEKDVVRFPSLPTGYPGFRLSLPYLRNAPDFDVIHAHSPFQTGLLARYLARKKGVPLVYTFHTLYTRYVHYAGFLPKRFAKMAMTTYLREFCRRVDLILAPSEMSKRALKKWGIGIRCEVSPSGVAAPETEGKAETRKKLLLPEKAQVLVHLGRLSKEKNILFLLEAFAKMYREDRYLLVIGGGPLLNELREAELPNVIFTGPKPHKEALSLLCAGDLFLFSSLTESQGLVLAEAKGAGLPVVALYSGSLVDTVRSGIDGYLTARSIGSFVEHAERLLNDPALREKMGREAEKDARERFAPAQVAKRVETLYNSLIK